MKRLIGAGALVAVLGTAAYGQIGTIGRSNIRGNADKTMWDVSAVPHVGTVLRITRDSRGRIVTVEKTSDWIADHLPADILETVNGGNQSVAVTSSTKVSVGIALLKIIGIDIGGGVDNTASTELKFSSVKVSQYKAQLPFLTAIQSMDAPGFKKDPEGNSLFALISDETSKKLGTRLDRSQYWIVTQVFTPASIEWTVNAKKNRNITINCTALSDKCGKIEGSGGNTVTGTQINNDVALSIVAKPLYTKGGNIIIGRISPKDAPANISG
jgi:hypothetical protein